MMVLSYFSKFLLTRSTPDVCNPWCEKDGLKNCQLSDTHTEKVLISLNMEWSNRILSSFVSGKDEAFGKEMKRVIGTLTDLLGKDNVYFEVSTYIGEFFDQGGNGTDDWNTVTDGDEFSNWNQMWGYKRIFKMEENGTADDIGGIVEDRMSKDKTRITGPNKYGMGSIKATHLSLLEPKWLELGELENVRKFAVTITHTDSAGRTSDCKHIMGNTPHWQSHCYSFNLDYVERHKEDDPHLMACLDPKHDKCVNYAKGKWNRDDMKARLAANVSGGVEDTTCWIPGAPNKEMVFHVPSEEEFSDEITNQNITWIIMVEGWHTRLDYLIENNYWECFGSHYGLELHNNKLLYRSAHILSLDHIIDGVMGKLCNENFRTEGIQDINGNGFQSSTPVCELPPDLGTQPPTSNTNETTTSVTAPTTKTKKNAIIFGVVGVATASAGAVAAAVAFSRFGKSVPESSGIPYDINISLEDPQLEKEAYIRIDTAQFN